MFMYDLSYKKEKYLKIKNLIESSGATIISKEFINNKTPIYFNCSRCGREHHIVYDQIVKGVNSDFLCLDCMKADKYKSESFSEIKKRVESTGAKLLSSEPINTHSYIDFLCSKCGSPWRIRYGDFKKGRNSQLLCLVCSKQKLKVKGELEVREFKAERMERFREEFASKGAKLLSTDYKNNTSYLYFECSRCGKVHKIQITNYISGSNPYLLCDICLGGERNNPNFERKCGRRAVDSFWYRLVGEFFNVPYDQRSNSKNHKGQFFSMHHIKRWSNYPEYSLSIVNGYPLEYSVHYSNYQFLHYGDGTQITNWPLDFKYIYADYDGFRFLDLNKDLITDIVLTQEGSKTSLYEKRFRYNEMGINYLPFYFEELVTKQKAEIVYSMIRSRLGKKYGEEIYKYTNTKFEKFYARKLKILSVLYSEAREFLEKNHIQGYSNFTIAYGLFDLSEGKQRLVSLMTFGSPRTKQQNGEGCFELIRFANLINSSVVGGASKLFNHFIKEHNPKKVVSYCDLRFSSLNPEETVYSKLGFTFEERIRPNYHYVDPETNRLYSRQAFQKHKLEKKLKDYNPELSEEENMIRNGYIKLYDCGNFRFMWTSTNIKD